MKKMVHLTQPFYALCLGYFYFIGDKIDPENFGFYSNLGKNFDRRALLKTYLIFPFIRAQGEAQTGVEPQHEGKLNKRVLVL